MDIWAAEESGVQGAKRWREVLFHHHYTQLKGWTFLDYCQILTTPAEAMHTKRVNFVTGNFVQLQHG